MPPVKIAVLRVLTKRILQNYPELSRNGFDFVDTFYGHQPIPCSAEERNEFRGHLVSDEGLEEIYTAIKYIEANGIEPRDTSYRLKHDAESWSREVGGHGYVSNGSAIVAAIVKGYLPVRETNSPNCHFKKNGNK